MPSAAPNRLQELRYEKEALAYFHGLPLEHFAQSVTQSMQWMFTVTSLDLVAARRSDFHVFTELLVLYLQGRTGRLGKVVPDNMIVLSDEPIKPVWSFNIPLEPARPLRHGARINSATSAG
jgi:hypothetical protein